MGRLPADGGRDDFDGLSLLPIGSLGGIESKWKAGVSLTSFAREVLLANHFHLAGKIQGPSPKKSGVGNDLRA